MEDFKETNHRIVVRASVSVTLEAFANPYRQDQTGRHRCDHRDWPAAGRGDIRYGWEESVSATGDGLDEHRLTRAVPEGRANLSDAIVQALVEFDVGPVGPYRPAQVLAGHQRPGPPCQLDQHSRRLRLKWNNRPVPGSELASRGIKEEATKPQHIGFDDGPGLPVSWQL